MVPATSDILFGSCVGGVAFVLGLTAVWLGYTAFGRIAPHPRAFWGMIGVGFMLVGVGVFLMGVESKVPFPSPEDVSATLVRSAGSYVLMLGLLIMGIWAPWAYLLQYLYTTKEVVIAGKVEIEHERSGHLRRRNLAAAAAGVGGTVGVLAAELLISFSRTAPLGDFEPIAVAVGVGCVVGGITFGMAFLALRIWLRLDLITERATVLHDPD